MLRVKIRFNDDNEDGLFCCFDKEPIRLGEKYAILVVDNFDGSYEESVYRLENLPTEDEVEE